MIKETYRGFEIMANREKSLGGWDNLYYCAYREHDGWCLEDDFTGGSDSEQTIISILKAHIDDFYEHPEDYEEDDGY